MGEGTLSVMPVKQIPVSSSIIQSATHDPDERKLYIKFHNTDKIFEYHPVSEHDVTMFMAAKSKGSFYHQQIKHKLKNT